jgi:sigma-54 interacting transcriptional regulator
MSFLESRGFLEDLFRLVRSNPFSSKWVDQEEKALGSGFQQSGTVHLWTDKKIGDHPNLVLLTDRTEEFAKELLGDLKDGARPNQRERLLYQYLILYLLYRRHRKGFDGLITAGEPNPAGELWQKFLADFNKFLQVSGTQSLTELAPEHVFAWFFQIRRAFRHIFDYIVGSSESVIKLRADVWNSIFTHDVQHYSERLYTRMSEFNTLITGDSGTGKELVARAIGRSQYIEFDRRKRQFKANFSDSFRAVNLAGLPASLIESELFGHVKGAFTGAQHNQKGWLETARNSDALFLDEIGELDHSVQVKILRALETRRFYRVGGHDEKKWKGKIIAATNRDLTEDVRKGRFRGDLYYRLCGDVISTPSLRTQLDESPGDLDDLVLFATRRIVGHDGEAIANTVRDWIVENMPDYPWPGNFRELEQCARNVLIRGEYRPVEDTQNRKFDIIEDSVHSIAKQELSMGDLEDAYCAAVYKQVGEQYKAAADIIGRDWRWVKLHVEPDVATSQKSGLYTLPKKG